MRGFLLAKHPFKFLELPLNFNIFFIDMHGYDH